MNNENLKNNSTSAPDLKRYETDVSGVSMKNLETGLWWVKNRHIFKKILIGVLAIFGLSTVSYSLFGFGHYFIKGMWDDKKMVEDLVNTTTVDREFLEKAAAKDLSLSAVGTIDGSGSYDIYLSVYNQNLKHWGVFSYCFKAGDEDLSCGENFILPNERKIISALSLKNNPRPNNINFVINQISWKKLNPHEIPDWEQYKKERLKIEIKNVSFKPAASNELSEKINLNSLTFSLSNLSAYGFWDFPLQVILYRSNRIVGINSYIVKEFYSYDARDIQMTWTGNFTGVNDIKILPDLNIMDENNYLKPGR